MNINKLKAIYTELGYNQKTLSEATGISYNTLNSKINLKSKFNIDEANLLCNFLNIPDDKKIEIFLSN